MPNIKELTTYLEQLAPLHYQESYDNAGLLVGDANTEITGVLVSLDCTETVVEEAIAKNCNIIVAHHPIIFKGLKQLTSKTYIERTVIKAIKNDVAIYAIHTNLDNVEGGVNFKIAEMLDLQHVKILSPKNITNENQSIGAGAIGELSVIMNEKEFLQYLNQKMNLSVIRHTPLLGKPIKRVAVCGGVGSFLLGNAIAEKADIFITADYKYHEFFDADNRIIIADIGHYESERFTKELLLTYISKKFINFATHLSEVNTNPISYFVK